VIRHLTLAHYRAMPWANGRGTTLELARADGPGGMLWRLSIASVIEDGPFSLFPGVDRILMVIDGPGFHLTGSGMELEAAPWVPVAFAGDVALAAHGVTAPSMDFNLMVARDHCRASLTFLGAHPEPAVAQTALLALEPGAVKVGDIVMRLARHDLVLLDEGHVASVRGSQIRCDMVTAGQGVIVANNQRLPIA